MRLLYALLAVLLLATPAHSAIAVVQTVSCSAHGATSCTTGAVTTTNGNLFVANSSYCCAAFTSVTDSKSNSYGNAIAATSDADGGTIRQDFIAAGTGGASHTFTLTGASGAFFGSLSVIEVSGAAASPLDKTATGQDSGTSHTTSNTATTSQADELLIGVGASIDITTYTTDTGAGWTERTNIATDVNTEGILTGSRVVSATGTYAYTYTSGTNDDFAQGISTWKAAAAGGGARQQCVGCGADRKVIE